MFDLHCSHGVSLVLSLSLGLFPPSVRAAEPGAWDRGLAQARNKQCDEASVTFERHFEERSRTEPGSDMSPQRRQMEEALAACILSREPGPGPQPGPPEQKDRGPAAIATGSILLLFGVIGIIAGAVVYKHASEEEDRINSGHYDNYWDRQIAIDHNSNRHEIGLGVMAGSGSLALGGLVVVAVPWRRILHRPVQTSVSFTGLRIQF